MNYNIVKIQNIELKIFDRQIMSFNLKIYIIQL